MIFRPGFLETSRKEFNKIVDPCSTMLETRSKKIQKFMMLQIREKQHESDSKFENANLLHRPP